MTRKNFTTDALLKHLADTDAACKICGKTARQTQLVLHHKNGDSSDNKWQNIVIYCIAHHHDKDGNVPKHRDE